VNFRGAVKPAFTFIRHDGASLDAAAADGVPATDRRVDVPRPAAVRGTAEDERGDPQAPQVPLPMSVRGLHTIDPAGLASLTPRPDARSSQSFCCNCCSSSRSCSRRCSSTPVCCRCRTHTSSAGCSQTSMAPARALLERAMAHPWVLLRVSIQSFIHTLPMVFSS